MAQVQAQPEIYETHFRPVPTLDLQNISVFQNSDPAPDAPSLEDKATAEMAQSWAKHLQKTLQSKKIPTRAREPSCLDAQFVEYLEGLYVNGRFEKCAEAVSKCSRRSVSEAIAWRGAQCATSLHRWDEALRLYQVSVRAKRNRSFESPLLFSYGSFLTVSPFASRQKELLQQAAPNLKAQQIDFLINTIEFSVLKKNFSAEKNKSIWDFYSQAASHRQKAVEAFFSFVKAQALYDRYRYQEARDFYNTKIKKISDVDHLWPLAFNLLYNNKPNLFKYSNLVYQAYLPYGHWRSSWPIESNNYTYTELYNTQCSQSLLQGEPLIQFKKQLKSWQNKSLSSDEFHAQVTASLKVYPNRADLLTTLGGLEMLKLNQQKALGLFWQAHQACPYYNRAHWGLLTLRRSLRQASYPDYDNLEQKYRKAIEGIDFGQNLDEYVVNYKNLNEEVQSKLKYGARIWGPYFDQLFAEDFRIYIKFAFELLSETPSLESLRDVRISGVNYPEDNRLWDDVRGAGGPMVIADFGELKQVAQGAYNTIGHEVAHQFHFSLMRSNPTAFNCIEGLYQEAKHRNLFADGYSAQNVDEYFAQAVTHHLVPEDSPIRFGINRMWNRLNDPKIDLFIQGIETQNIGCGSTF